MEIRVLRYFLEIAREENMTKAAQRLHVSQPTLSRTMKELEEELGKPLFARSNYSIHLTDEGMLLRKRAEDLLNMADKITNEFKSLDELSSGEVYIGCAESKQSKYLASAIKRIYQEHPGIHYEITSGDTGQVREKLDKGLYDFALIVEPPDLSQYNYIEIPEVDSWGAIMNKNHPLANHNVITFDDLLEYPIFTSKQAYSVDLPRWCGEKSEQLNLLASFNLSTNAGFFSQVGLGVTLTFEHLIDTSENSNLVFKPLYPKLTTKMYVIWKKYQMFTPAAQLLLDEMKKFQYNK